ncbi:hypothetical protein [Allomesorhizobium camelthorni]|uniref:Uncharacterized protein n=1 Tax=Allomesorhizobium camelthorni TaxID=475069 RepID=A0A6G4WFG5_9HYPH|nr:hypothetical protein [Mesorhizobium camelthorni]NGO52870.1 hypothetical protein [Mesorhizobium camelthorni]
MRFIILAAALAAAAPAHASGGLWCDNVGGPVKISIQSGVTRGMGFPVFDFRASSEVDNATIGDDLRKTTFDGGNLPQYWSHGENLNMVLYRERDTDIFGSVEIIILTMAAGDDIEYSGTYSFTAYDAGGNNGQGSTVTHTGKISCGVE